MSVCILFVDKSNTTAWKGTLGGAFQQVYQILMDASPPLPCSEPTDKKQLYAKIPQMEEESLVRLLGIFLYDHVLELPKTRHPNKRGDYFKDIGDVLREIPDTDTALVLRLKGRGKSVWGLGMFYHSAWEQEFEELPAYLAEQEVHTIFRANNYQPFAINDREEEQEGDEEMIDEEEEQDNVHESIIDQMQRVNLVTEDGAVSGFATGDFQLPVTQQSE